MMEAIYAEEIIRIRQYEKKKTTQREKEEHYNIENDISKGYVTVHCEKIALKETDIMGGRARMLLPEHMQTMPEPLMLMKYPDPARPEWILSDPKGEITIAMNLEKGVIGEGELEQITEVVEGELQHLYPDSSVEREKTVGKGRERVCWFSLDIPLIDGWCCHVMFFREMKDGLLMGTFDCSRSTKKQWKPILKQLLGTIREDIRKNGDRDRECIE